MPASETNRELAEHFEIGARMLDLRGANAFKAVAFRKVATRLENLAEDVRAIYASGGRRAIEDIDDIGKSSAGIIVDLLEAGVSGDLDELAADVPPDVVGMLDVPGLGPKTVGMIWREREIETFAALEAALDDGSLLTLKGLGTKKVAQIREGLAMREAATRRRALGAAVRLSRSVRDRLAEIDGVESVESAGSVRRGRETVGDLDFVVASSPDADPAAILRAFSEFPEVESVQGLGSTKSSVRTTDGLQMDCRVVPSSSFGAALCYFTGSKAHNQRLRGRARSRGLTLNEWGLYEAAMWDAREREAGAVPSVTSVAGAAEADIYAALDLAYIPPELREDAGEIERAEAGDLPALIDVCDYRGDLHCHTHASDGVGSIEDMAEAAKALGYRFLAITDHSVSQAQANGLNAERLRRHVRAIREANDRIEGIELLAGTEVDILANGELDYSDDELEALDWVIASPHAALRQDSKRATDRLLRAIRHPCVNAIGHPTGRLINARKGLPLDFPSVFAAAAETGTALEINANYHRLDLAAEHARAAVQAGCRLSINTDAHSPDHLGKLDGGLVTARRGWVRSMDVINCMSVDALRDFVAAKRH